MPLRPEHLAHFHTLAAQRPPAVVRVVAGLVIVALAAAAAGLVFTPWVQTAAGTGSLVSLDPRERVQAVTALVPGRVAEWFVQDGQAVKRGAPIARIVDNDPSLLARLAAERAQVATEIGAAEQGVAVARIDEGRSLQLFAEGLGARRDFEAAQIRVADLQAKAAAARAKLNRADVALTRQSAQLVLAPRNGRIQQINAGAGATLVSPGDTLATFAPEATERAVELYMSGRDAPLLRPGRRVRLEFEGWPAVQFSGWPSVARGLFDGRVRALDATASANGLFRILVEPSPDRPPWPEPRYLRLGAKVRGWVQMETVPAGYELWRQLNAFPLQFPKPGNPAGGKLKKPNKGDAADKAGGGDKDGGDDAK